MLTALLTVFGFIVQTFTAILFFLVSGYVFATGKSKTGIKIDYAFFALLCGVVFFVL